SSALPVPTSRPLHLLKTGKQPSKPQWPTSPCAARWTKSPSATRSSARRSTMPPSLSRPGNKRQKANLYGQRSEALAAFFLQLKFYRIRDRRYKTPGGEIDVVAERGGTIVFVEVKSRLKAASEAEALEAINQARIIR